MKRTEEEFYATIEHMKNLLKDNSPTPAVFRVQKLIARFEGLIDLEGNLTTPSNWYTLDAKQIEFINCIKAICNLKISYSAKVSMINLYLTAF